MSNEIIRRGMYIPRDLDIQVDVLTNKYAYASKNKMYVELLELGLIKFHEDNALKDMIVNTLAKVNELIDKIK